MIKYHSLGAIYSDCGRFRYVLYRQWDRSTRDSARLTRHVAVIGLNPSTATHEEDDPTMRRLAKFAKREGSGGLVMLNLFAFRAPKPQTMKSQSDPVGPMNDYWIHREVQAAAEVWVAWGSHGSYLCRDLDVRDLLEYEGIRVRHFGLTKSYQPKHPLYLKSDAVLMDWTTKDRNLLDR